MPRIRPAAVADIFYSGHPRQLYHEIDGYLASVESTEGPPPKALIVPHAGYLYSGPIAASGYMRLRGHATNIIRVVLAGPAHRLAFSGIAVPDTDAFETPLGLVPIDLGGVAVALGHEGVCTLDEAHALEHGLEVHLPFLQYCLDAFHLVPLLVGEVAPHVVAEVLERLWDDKETLVVISSDLSHYLDYATAQCVDAVTNAAILDFQPESIDADHACGWLAIRGLLECARRHGLTPVALDLRNSGDTAGPQDRVVGYGAYAFYPNNA